MQAKAELQVVWLHVIGMPLPTHTESSYKHQIFYFKLQSSGDLSDQSSQKYFRKVTKQTTTAYI